MKVLGTKEIMPSSAKGIIIDNYITNSYKINYKRVNKNKRKNIIYPDSDGKRMADNTKQFNWIVKIKENLERMFADNPDVFIAGDLLWYPVEGNNKLRIAPDAMVVFGRPKGHRGSYKNWQEENISPQVVFEILSPCNTSNEMEKKLKFYEKYGVEEYYEYDPDKILIKGFKRNNNQLEKIEEMQGFISPILKVKFEILDNDLKIFFPDGSPFLTSIELDQLHLKEIQLEKKRTELAEENAKLEKKRAEKEIQLEKKRAEKEIQLEKKRAELAEENAKLEKKRAEKEIQLEKKRTELAEENAKIERERAKRMAIKLKELGIESF